ncbi:MAG: carbohydrate kinase family protein, partial [Anaerolineae bacterium]|nr:carbohydrate kinase family protein [Anaerolineae bacterium]
MSKRGTMDGGKSVVCLGILVADVVGRPLKALPDRGRLVLVDEMSLHTGGCAINTATALARLDVPVEVTGRIGPDAFGDFLLSELHSRGIGVGSVSRDPEIGTSVTMVMVDTDGERRFVHCIGANARLTLEDVDWGVIERASIVHVAGALVLPGMDGEPTAELLGRARSMGVTTFLDTVWDDTGQWMRLLEPCLPYAGDEARGKGIARPCSIHHVHLEGWHAQRLAGVGHHQASSGAHLQANGAYAVIQQGAPNVLRLVPPCQRLRLCQAGD